MQQLVAQITAGSNKQNIECNNWLLELQPAVMLQFFNITAGIISTSSRCIQHFVYYQ